MTARRPSVVRARLTAEEYELFQQDAQAAGNSLSEHARGLIVGHRGELAALNKRLDNLCRRVERVEDQLAGERFGRIDVP